MKLKNKHFEAIEQIVACQIEGDGISEMARRCAVSRPTIYRWLRDPAFRQVLDQRRALWDRDIGQIRLTRRRARIEDLAAIAEDPATNDSIKLRALKQIADETAADVEGMLEALQEQIDLLERQIAGEVGLALHRPEGKSPMKLKNKHFESIEQIVACEIEGGGISEMARRCAVSRPTIYRWLRDSAFRQVLDQRRALWDRDIGQIRLR